MDEKLRKGCPPGWSRHPQHPHACIVHDSGQIRINKSMVFSGPKYAVGQLVNGHWTRPAILTQDSLDDAVREAEKLI